MLSYRVAWLQSQGQVPNYEASVAKMYGSELAQRLARRRHGPARPRRPARARLAARRPSWQGRGAVPQRRSAHRRRRHERDQPRHHRHARPRPAARVAPCPKSRPPHSTTKSMTATAHISCWSTASSQAARSGRRTSLRCAPSRAPSSSSCSATRARPRRIDPAPYTPDGYVRAFERIREDLGADRWFICGQSLGAALTLRYTLEHPDRVMAQVFTNSTSALAEDGWSAQIRPAMEAQAARLEAQGHAVLDEHPLNPARSRRLDPGLRGEFERDVALHSPHGLAIPGCTRSRLVRTRPHRREHRSGAARRRRARVRFEQHRAFAGTRCRCSRRRLRRRPRRQHRRRGGVQCGRDRVLTASAARRRRSAQFGPFGPRCRWRRRQCPYDELNRRQRRGRERRRLLRRRIVLGVIFGAMASPSSRSDSSRPRAPVVEGTPPAGLVARAETTVRCSTTTTSRAT